MAQGALGGAVAGCSLAGGGQARAVQAGQPPNHPPAQPGARLGPPRLRLAPAMPSAASMAGNVADTSRLEAQFRLVQKACRGWQ